MRAEPISRTGEADSSVPHDDLNQPAFQPLSSRLAPRCRSGNTAPPIHRRPAGPGRGLREHMLDKHEASPVLSAVSVDVAVLLRVADDL